jgi:hypothetical protein
VPAGTGRLHGDHHRRQRRRLVTASDPRRRQHVGASGTHTYAEEGKYAVSWSVRDAGGSSAVGSGTATVADAPLQATGKSLKLTAHKFSGVLATFTDADLGGILSDYSATISLTSMPSTGRVRR